MKFVNSPWIEEIPGVPKTPAKNGTVDRDNDWARALRAIMDGYRGHSQGHVRANLQIWLNENEPNDRDVDNMAKSVLDLLEWKDLATGKSTGVLHDDGDVVDLHILKKRGVKRSSCVKIRLEWGRP